MLLNSPTCKLPGCNKTCSQTSSGEYLEFCNKSHAQEYTAMAQKQQGQKAKGAGVLVYKIEHNTLFFLLAKDVHKQTWSDFGGRIDNKETFEKTAQREAYEESATVLKYSESSLQKCTITTMFRDYKMFLVESPISRIDMIQQFYEYRYSNPSFAANLLHNLSSKESSAKSLNHAMKEKSHVRWIPSRILRMAIERARRREEDAKLKQEIEGTDKTVKIPRDFPLVTEADYLSEKQLFIQDIPHETMKYFFSRSLETLYASEEFAQFVASHSTLQY